MYNSSNSGIERIALLVSPRTGNNWLRLMLMSACDLQGFAINNPNEFDWRNAPAKCVVAMHWHPTNELQEVLEKGCFKVVTLFRHPLDVLISILQYTFNHSTQRWLEGKGGSEDSILGTMPRSQAFVDYARSPRAQELLSVTNEWARIPGVHKVSYENLVHDTFAEMKRLLTALGLVPCHPLDLVIEKNTMIETMTPGHPLYYHCWQGKPNNWKKLLTAVEAKAMAHPLQPFFSAGGYTCDPDNDLTPSQADANWVALCGAKFVESHRQTAAYVRRLEDYKLQLVCAKQECEDLKQAIQFDRRGILRAKALIRSFANIFVPFQRVSSEERAA